MNTKWIRNIGLGSLAVVSLVGGVGSARADHYNNGHNHNRGCSPQYGYSNYGYRPIVAVPYYGSNLGYGSNFGVGVYSSNYGVYSNSYGGYNNFGGGYGVGGYPMNSSYGGGAFPRGGSYGGGAFPQGGSYGGGAFPRGGSYGGGGFSLRIGR